MGFPFGRIGGRSDDSGGGPAEDRHGQVQGVSGDAGNSAVIKATESSVRRTHLASRLAYHLRCLSEDAADPELTSLERLALIRDRARRMREIRGTLRARLASGRKLP